MKAYIIALAALGFSTVAAAAQQEAAGENISRPTIGMGSKTFASCTVDRQKVCANATDYMVKECLVQHWNVISSDCQDGLGHYFDGAAPHR